MSEQTAEKKIEWMQAEIDRLQNAQIRMLKISAKSVRQAEYETRQARQERDELIEMLKEILRENYISNSRRKAAYDLVVRLGGYHGKTEGQTDEYLERIFSKSP